MSTLVNYCIIEKESGGHDTRSLGYEVNAMERWKRTVCASILAGVLLVFAGGCDEADAVEGIVFSSLDLAAAIVDAAT